MSNIESNKIIRKRTFIEHDDKDQTSVRKEITFRVGNTRLQNMFLVSEEFRPNLTVKDESGKELPLMSIEDITHFVEHDTGGIGSEEVKGQFREILESCEKGDKFILGIPLDKEMKVGELRMIILTYTPSPQIKEDNYMSIDILNQSNSAYYSLLPHLGFEFGELKYFKTVNEQAREIAKPENIKIYRPVNGISIRVKPPLNEPTIIRYKIKLKAGSIRWAHFGAFMLSVIQALALFSIVYDWSEALNMHQVEIGLFTLGIAIIIPTFHPDVMIREKLKFVPILPIILGCLLIFIPHSL